MWAGHAGLRDEQQGSPGQDQRGSPVELGRVQVKPNPIALPMPQAFYCLSSAFPTTTLFSRKYAWNFDEMNAQSRQALSWFHMGLTVVDSLDTLLILGLDEEFAEARNWVANHLDFEQQMPVSVRRIYV